MLQGRFAGRKAVVVRASDEGNDSKKFGHAVGKSSIRQKSLYLPSCLKKSCIHFFLVSTNMIVAGIDRYPRKIVKAMGKKKVEKRSKVKPFLKTVNFNHIMPTR